jgi:copper chaperone NosL
MTVPRISRWLTAAGATVLLAALALPLWHIRLIAPQYPEGLGLVIRVNTVTGASPTDLDNINALNHYIGMKPIVPEAIPVLHVMPVAVAGLVILGLLAAWSGRRAAIVGWLATFLVLALAGLVEFWWWTYDYGHHLDTVKAIIKIPGMTYQPPLIGSRQLLNFTATAWPGAGAWVAVLAFGLGAAAVAIAVRQARSAHRGAPAIEPAPLSLVRSA